MKFSLNELISLDNFSQSLCLSSISSSSLLLVLSFILFSFLFEFVFEFDFELSSSLFEVFDSELLSDSLLSLLLDLEWLSSDFSDFVSDADSDFLELVTWDSVILEFDFFEFFTEDELKLELSESKFLLDFEILLFLDFLEIFESFFFFSRFNWTWVLFGIITFFIAN